MFDCDPIRDPIALTFRRKEVECRLVLSSSLVKLGVASPLQPFVRDVFETYHLNQIQINSNGYRSMIAIYIIYKKEGFGSRVHLSFHVVRA